MDGSDDEDNLIDLFAKEHFIAHKLLALENPDNSKIAFAYTCMAFMKNDDMHRYELSPEEYEDAKIARSKLNSDMAKERFQDIENHPMYGKHHSEETKDKISEKNKNPSEEKRKKISKAHKGKPLSEETKKKIGEKSKGRALSEEAKQKISEKNSNPSEETRRKKSEARKGIVFSEETRRKLSEAAKGRIVSDETRRKIIKTSSTPIIQLTKSGEFVFEYIGSSEAHRITGISAAHIRDCCNNKRISAGGYLWIDKSEYNQDYIYSYNERKQLYNQKNK